MRGRQWDQRTIESFFLPFAIPRFAFLHIARNKCRLRYLERYFFTTRGIPRKRFGRDYWKTARLQLLFDHIAVLNHALQTTTMVNEISRYRNLESRGNVVGCMRTGRLPRHTYGHLPFLRKYSRAALSFTDRRSAPPRKAEVQLNSHQNESESVVKAWRRTALRDIVSALFSP